jgi:hypothetical protein
MGPYKEEVLKWFVEVAQERTPGCEIHGDYALKRGFENRMRNFS